jgi:hypothetical protein
MLSCPTDSEESLLQRQGTVLKLTSTTSFETSVCSARCPRTLVNHTMWIRRCRRHTKPGHVQFDVVIIVFTVLRGGFLKHSPSNSSGLASQATALVHVGQAQQKRALTDNPSDADDPDKKEQPTRSILIRLGFPTRISCQELRESY